jgi:hypothetical protein
MSCAFNTVVRQTVAPSLLDMYRCLHGPPTTCAWLFSLELVLHYFRRVYFLRHLGSICDCVAVLCYEIFYVREIFFVPRIIYVVENSKKYSQIKLTAK